MEEIKYGQIISYNLVATDIDGARGQILNLLERISDDTTIYFDGWDGLGTAAVLRSVAHILHSMQDPHSKLCFGRIIYIDCSKWESKRVMQRRIAEELKLDSKIMVMFDKQDEDDDFSGVSLTSRDEIRDVAKVIHRTLMESSFMMIFLNGSDEEVVLSRLGFPEFHESIIIWTFKKGFPTRGSIRDVSNTNLKEIPNKLRNTIIYLGFFDEEIPRQNISALVREVAASILAHHPYMRDDDRAVVIDCYLYVLFLLGSFHEGTSRLWAAHGANYWICDGIIQGARTRDISKALCQEVSFDSLLHSNSSFLFSGELWKLVDLPHHWISITSEDMILRENMENIDLAMASSVFLTFKITNSPQGLPDDLMEQCNNLRVLILSNCAFNFLPPPFGHCSTLRFLGLEHCITNYTRDLVVREDYTGNWACLRSLWVLDVRHTDWVEILSEGNMDLMGNIMELDIEGSMCWQDAAAKLEGRLPYLERLRIVKPHRREAEASMEIIDSSFMGKTKLQVLDLSGNKDMEKRTRPFIAQPNNFGLQVHAVTADARLARSLWPPIDHHAKKEEKGVFFDIRITSSSISCDEKTSEEHQQYLVMMASPYNDVSTSVTRVQAFPQPPASRLDRHVEIGDGSHSVGSEVEVNRYDTPNLAHLMANYVQSLHVHDTSTSTAMPQLYFPSLKWCRVERCPRLDTVFPPDARYPHRLETIWASDLLMARCIWSKYEHGLQFEALQHLHLRSCPSLQFALPVGSSLPMLETIHIIHCGSLMHVFALDNMKHGIPNSVCFPELTTIHLHDVPALRQICEVKTMFAPKLHTIRTRGCWNLRRLPAVLKPVERGRRRPAVEMEKDVWDKLEWDGVEAGHHPSLYEVPLHSRYYKRRYLRISVLR